MQRYQRFLRRVPTEAGLHQEEAELARMLEWAPGANKIEILGPHPKGGFRVKFDLLPGNIDAFISHMDTSGWLSVF